MNTCSARVRVFVTPFVSLSLGLFIDYGKTMNNGSKEMMKKTFFAETFSRNFWLKVSFRLALFRRIYF